MNTELPSWHTTAMQLSFPSCGPKSDQYADDDQYLVVAQCEIPDVAFGNCDIVADEIVESCAENCETLYAYPLSDGFGNYHVAIFDPADERVFDYTIRQYDYSLPFPFVGTKDEWLSTLSEFTDWSLDRRDGPL